MEVLTAALCNLVFYTVFTEAVAIRCTVAQIAANLFNEGNLSLLMFMTELEILVETQSFNYVEKMANQRISRQNRGNLLESRKVRMLEKHSCKRKRSPRGRRRTNVWCWHHRLIVPPEACFANFRWDDCGKPPVPVMYYWKAGSRCEVGIWRGCLPNLNMFQSEYECVSTCIFSVSPRSGNWHEIFKEEEIDYYVNNVESTTVDINLSDGETSGSGDKEEASGDKEAFDNGSGQESKDGTKNDDEAAAGTTEGEAKNENSKITSENALEETTAASE